MRYSLLPFALLSMPLQARNLDVWSTTLDLDIDVRGWQVVGTAARVAQPLTAIDALANSLKALDGLEQRYRAALEAQ